MKEESIFSDDMEESKGIIQQIIDNRNESPTLDNRLSLSKETFDSIINGIIKAYNPSFEEPYHFHTSEGKHKTDGRNLWTLIDEEWIPVTITD